MPQLPQEPGTSGLGRGMMVMAWVLLLVLLAGLFQGVLEQRVNPNAEPRVEVAVDGAQEVVLRRNAQGHYVVSGEIDGRPVVFLVDTGATDVALPEGLAVRLGLRRLGGGISRTANGPVAVWRTRLREVSIGPLRVRDVPASIVPSMGEDDQVLLGMSVLKRLDLTQREGRLTLRLPAGR